MCYHNLVSAANDVLFPFKTMNFSQLGQSLNPHMDVT